MLARFRLRRRLNPAEIEPRTWAQRPSLPANESAQQISQLTDGTGVDIAVEAVGKTETVNTAIDSVRKGGSVVLVGNISPEITLPLQKVVTRQIRLQGSCASAGEYPRAIELHVQWSNSSEASHHGDSAARCRAREWFERLYAREPNLMKVVLDTGSDHCERQ